MSTLQFLDKFWQDVAGWGLILYLALTVGTLLWILQTKRETMSAIAWSLTVITMPLLGSILFFLFGIQVVHRPLERKRRRRQTYLSRMSGLIGAKPRSDVPPPWDMVAKIGYHKDGFPAIGGNRVRFFTHGEPAYEAMLDAIRRAERHVHLEFFIFRADDSGRRFIDALAAAARRGVEVRFMYDAVGSYILSSKMLRGLRRAGGKAAAFLPIFNPLYRMRVNLRNHRKILVVDGKTAFTGGFNIGDEYLGKHAKFGPWRDTHLQLDGPAVASLQRVFLEDWFFATEELLDDEAKYLPAVPRQGDTPVQVVHSGPDNAYKVIRETYVAAILRARKRVWVASPYFVPDLGLLDALVIAGRSGLDVRFLCLFRPDKWIPFLAARYYWTELLDAGVKVYQYAAGMMHSKMCLVDGEFASVGTANFDNRSLYLNFEVNCLIYDPAAAAELERHYEEDLRHSIRLDPGVYASRPRLTKLAENASRLFSPIL